MKLIFGTILFLTCNTTYADNKIDFKGDAFVRGYFKNSTGNDGTQAFNQYFRLNIDAKPDDNLAIKSGIILSGNTWEGDNHTTPATANGVDQDGGGGDTIRLDHASIDYVKNCYSTTIGRVAVTSPGSFLTSDDRRDRFQLLKFVNNGIWAFIYDKRSEGLLNNGRDDLDMFSISYFGKTTYFKYAVQTGYWTSKTNYSLKDLKQITPQLEGDWNKIYYKLYYTLLTGGANNVQSLFPKTHHAAALVLSKEFGESKLSYQSILTSHGGLIAGGYDTFSSIINNSPDHHQSSIKLRSIGSGFGRQVANERINIIKLAFKINNDFSGSVSAGLARLYVYAVTAASSKLENNNVVDATLKYTISKNLSLDMAYGKFFRDNKDHAGSLTVNAIF
jgi:hypothetical protein